MGCKAKANIIITQQSCIFIYTFALMKGIEDILQSHKLKNTKLRKAVLALLMQSDKGLSHLDISKKLDVAFDRVTLFRTLHSFEESGILHKIIDPNGIAKYAYTASGRDETENNHAHFICLKCEEVFCLNDVFPLTDFKMPQGFSKAIIEVQVKGLCARCN